MPSTSKTLKRKPLSDLTNANANANANAAAPPKTSASRSSSSANHDGVLAKSSAIFGPRIPETLGIEYLNWYSMMAQCLEHRYQAITLVPRCLSQNQRHLNIHGAEEGKEVQGKALVDSVALGYSEERIKNFGRKLKERRDFFPCTISVSQKTKRKYHHKRRPDDLRGSVLSNDFIEKQRAYFAEVDAFQLPEEEVSEGDLE
uniref:Sororin C-terminal region domain-containing protein n=1 Tax=Ananas comosus var. bracteatus TaxID=296719 RepID=A0A6V7PE55_ANACO|nr:unnamed protein product [Ananas comosus var. bracteatus]